MIELVARKLTSGDVYVAKCRAHLQKNEWGMAYRSVETALLKGNLSEEDSVIILYSDVCERLGLAPRLDIAAGLAKTDEHVLHCLSDQVRANTGTVPTGFGLFELGALTVCRT